MHFVTARTLGVVAIVAVASSTFAVVGLPELRVTTGGEERGTG
jgi:hypothetical protein